MAVQINGTTGVSLVQDNIISSSKIISGAVLPIHSQVGALPSMVRLNTANGYGSTNTMIRRFTNVVTNQGSDITYADSATLGASFTINANGVYAISYTENLNTASIFGVSLNSSQLTTAFSSISITDRIAATDIYAVNGTSSCATTLYLTSGSIIRPHTGGFASANSTIILYTITRVA